MKVSRGFNVKRVTLEELCKLYPDPRGVEVAGEIAVDADNGNYNTALERMERLERED